MFIVYQCPVNFEAFKGRYRAALARCYAVGFCRFVVACTLYRRLKDEFIGYVGKLIDVFKSFET